MKIYLFLEGKFGTTLEVIFDWVSITFKTLDCEKIISDVMQVNIDLMEKVESGLNNYKGYYELDDIKVFFHTDNESMGTNIWLSGEGCRQFEFLLKQQNRTWHEFFKTAEAYKGKPTRLDIAVNDYVRMLDIKELYNKYQNGELETTFHRIAPIFEDNIQTKEAQGVTLYFGSKKSDFFIRFYEKDLEVQKKKRIPRELYPIKNRYECVIKGEKAQNVLAEYVHNDNIEKIAFDILNHYLRFYDSEDGIPKEEWKINKRWAEFIGEAETMKLTVSPSEYFYEKTRNWLENYCAKSIYAIKKIDMLNKTVYFNNMVNSAGTRLDPKHENMIKVATAKPEDLIVRNK